MSLFCEKKWLTKRVSAFTLKEFYEMDLVLNACAFLEAKANVITECKNALQIWTCKCSASTLSIMKLCIMAEYYYAECHGNCIYVTKFTMHFCTL